MNKLAVTAVISTCLLASGCASIFTSKYQTVSVQTQEKQSEITDAECSLQNNKGSWTVTTPGEVKVRRSHRDLQVICEKETEKFAPALVGSDVRPWFFGNLLFGGLIGMIVDYAHGPGFGYPKEIIVDKDSGYLVSESKTGRGR